MRFVGILLLDALFMIASCFANSRGKNAKELISAFVFGTILLFAWSIGVYYAVRMIVVG